MLRAFLDANERRLFCYSNRLIISILAANLPCGTFLRNTKARHRAWQERRAHDLWFGAFGKHLRTSSWDPGVNFQFALQIAREITTMGCPFRQGNG